MADARPTDAAPGRLVGYLEAALAARLPRLERVATAALAARVPHTEAAGLLAEAVADDRVLLVLDELERLEESPDAWAVIEALLRYAGDGLRVVLISRRSVPLAPRRPPQLLALSATELAFTPAEAAEALAVTGAGEIDAATALQATGGWVTGVLFEAWRSREHVAGAGGEADPLHGYLSAHILELLAPADRGFLVRTAVLDEVTASRATALGHRDAAARLASLRAEHLPAVWRDDGRVLRPHPRFRETRWSCSSATASRRSKPGDSRTGTCSPARAATRRRSRRCSRPARPRKRSRWPSTRSSP